MLQTFTVEAKIFELLKALMRDQKLEHFQLVGGTALALYLGHRKSIDLDLFSHHDFNVQELENHLIEIYGFRTDRQSEVTLIGDIDGVKVDLIRYSYPLVEPVNYYDGIRLYPVSDIAAMKLTAIMQSGRRLKDFVDVAFLSTRMSLDGMLEVFEKKFPNTSTISAVRGLAYFDDIDFSTGVHLINGIFQWEKVERRIVEMIKNSGRIFPQMDFFPKVSKSKTTKTTPIKNKRIRL